jgi:4-amino-4-deoxy-L-arabinose transferase-like glycosyltransferase
LFQTIQGLFERTRVQISVVVVVAFLMRFVLATSSDLDIDEARAYAPTALAYLSANWTRNTSHPMVVKLLFAGSIFLFGEHGRMGTLFPWLPESIGALRFVSTIMGAASCLVIYYLVKEVTGRHLLAIIASILLAFDPISVGESSYGLLDPGMTLFYMLAIVYFYRYAKTGKALDFYASAILFGLAVSSKYFAFIAIFILIGILLWKGKISTEWKSMAVFLWISVLVFFAVQPYLWSSPLVNLSKSWLLNRNHLMRGELVKQPGNPFFIDQTRLYGRPWPHIGSKPFAPKPDFYSNAGDAVRSPWWYLLYIQAVYSTPFELVVYPVAAYKVVRSVLLRRANDLTVMAALLVLTPTVWFALMTVRLPQYTILVSTSSVVLGSVAFAGLSPRRERWLLLSLAVFHVGTTLYALSTSGTHFSGWDFYTTPLTPVVAGLFGLLWKLTQAAVKR